MRFPWLALANGWWFLTAAVSGQGATSVSLPTIQDAFVTPGPTDNLVANNYGGAGAMEVSGTALSKGQSHAVMMVDFATARGAFDSAYGSGGWKVDSVSLKLTASSPNNPIFNGPTAAGKIMARWVPDDTWVEGTGNPNNPGTEGLTWQLFASLLTGAQGSGSLDFDGVQTTADYALVASAGLLDDIANGTKASLVLSPEDTTVTCVFNTRSFGTAANRPVLTVTASPLPVLGRIAVQYSDLTEATPGDTHGFGNVDLGMGSSQPVKLRNTGTGPLNIFSVTLVDGNSGDFALDKENLAASLVAGGETTFNTIFIPTTVGLRSTTLRIVTNDPERGTFDITLTGTGVGRVGTLGFSLPAYTVDQGATAVELVVTRTGGTLPADVTIQTDNGTVSSMPPFAAAVATGVTATSDYVDLAGAATTVSFGDGETSRTVTVTLIAKTGTVPNKRFTATLSAPTNGGALGTASAAVRILANDTTRPSLTITTPAAGAKVSAALPFMVSGTAKDSNGIDRIELVLNGGDPVVLIPAAANWSQPIQPVAGANTLVATVYDLQGNATTLTRAFTFTQRHLLTVVREVPAAHAVKPDNAGAVAMTAVPTVATALAPSTANTNPKQAQILPGTAVKLTATAKTACAFAGWSGLPTGALQVSNGVTFVMPAEPVTVAALFVANPFAGVAGSGGAFQGLLHAESGTVPSNATEGFLAGTLNASSGVFTGKVYVDGLAQSIAATFFGDGSAWFTVGTAKTRTLSFGARTLTLSYNAGTGNDQISAMLVKGGDTTSGVATRAVYSTTRKLPVDGPLTAAVVTSGYYTVRLPSLPQTPAKDSTLYPQGDSYATMTLSSTGGLSCALVLADGTAATCASSLIQGDQCPVFAQIVTPGAAATVKGGSFGSLLTFTRQADSDVTGPCLWFRPAVTAVLKPAAAAAATNLYTGGWPEGIATVATGALYSTKVNVQTALGLGAANAATGNASLVFSLGKLTAEIVRTSFNINASSVVKTVPADASYTLVPVVSKGTFSGGFTPNWAQPAAAKPVYKGVLLQKGSLKGGYGFFLSNATGDLDPESGGVWLGGVGN